ncbi:hypothetical protein IC229_32170 [Spirosoma sp. BT702]|uniref:Uncharacterized protein n=1 Tax=Spirosoma profusum TaxID=2771354 RepID=A0A927AVV3_9BACT|nr:hypothetical protein [Spirosoma profusum]MBD2705319.1 hypothetical protein [Spirosoma profusum]
MKFTTIIILLLNVGFALSCRQRLCQSPPPSYNFAFINPQGQSVFNDTLQAGALRLSYASSTGTRSIVSKAEFKPLVTNDQYKILYQVQYNVFAQAEQNQYTVEIDNKAIGSLTLTSRRDNSECDGWMHLTEVRFNNQQIALGANLTYVITVK